MLASLHDTAAAPIELMIVPDDMRAATPKRRDFARAVEEIAECHEPVNCASKSSRRQKNSTVEESSSIGSIMPAGRDGSVITGRNRTLKISPAASKAPLTDIMVMLFHRRIVTCLH